MQYRILGRTGLKASVMGLGCGGPSRLGKATGRSLEESVRIIEEALDNGVNFLDTAEGYGTESVVGRAIQGRDRRSLVISTKKSTLDDPAPRDLEASLKESLRRLGTDYIDIYNLHAVTVPRYERMLKEMLPVMLEARESGVIRYVGLTEYFNDARELGDTGHSMAQRALGDGCWDTLMVGFNILNQSARERVFPEAKAKGVGTIVMYAVRRALSRPQRLREVIERLLEKGSVDPGEIDREDPLGFLVHAGGARSLVDAAYRFCAHEPGVDVVLSGTGSMAHLRENLESFSRPPLPAPDVLRLKRIFARVDSVSGQ